MGMRFRKSFGKGPFKVTLSKSGVGYSVGTKGFRVTKKASGGMRTTASIPGTGTSYVKEIGDKSNRAPASSGASVRGNVSESNTGDRYCSSCYRKMDPSSNICPNCGKSNTGTNTPGRKPFYKRTWFAVAVLLLILASCGRKNSAAEAEATDAPTVAPIVTEAAPTETEPAATGVDVSAIFAGQGANSMADTGNSYVLNTSTNIFHEPGCHYADEIAQGNRETFSGSRSDVIADGYEACEYCNP